MRKFSAPRSLPCQPVLPSTCVAVNSLTSTAASSHALLDPSAWPPDAPVRRQRELGKKEFRGQDGRSSPGIALQCVCFAWLCVRAHPQQTHPADVLVSVQALTTTPHPPVVGEPVLLTNTAVGLVLGVA